MQDGIVLRRATGSRWVWRLAAAMLASGVMVAGCGGSSHTPTTASAAGAAATSSTVGTGGGAPSSGSTAAGAGSPGVAFAACMRSHGVPNFPDPSPGGGLLFRVTAAINRSSPAFRAAQAKCRKLLPGGGPPGPGSATHPSRADAGEAAQDRPVHAPARDLPVPRPQDLRPAQPVRLRLRSDNRLRRSDPSVPKHDRHAVAGLQAGLGRVRRAAAWPPALTGTGVRRQEVATPVPAAWPTGSRS